MPSPLPPGLSDPNLPPRRGGRLIALLRAICLIVPLWLAAVALNDTLSDPVVHSTAVVLSELPADTPPMRIALISDLHVVGPDMPPRRLERIVGQINALHPDLVLIAGDFASDRWIATKHYSYAELMAPIAGLKAPLGTVAVLGNHDYWNQPDQARAELAKVGVTVLANQAVQRGSVIVGGIDDWGTQHQDIKALRASIPDAKAPLILLSHNPDVFHLDLPPSPLHLGGHFHCGQIGWPWGGTPVATSYRGEDFAYPCGRSDKDGVTTIITAGLGNSLLPFRLFVKPDIWLVTVKPVTQ